MAPSAPSQTFARRLWRGIRWGGLALIGVVVVAYAARGPLLSGPLSRLLADQATALLGTRCEVRSVRGDFFHEIEVQGFRTVVPAASGPLRTLSVRRFEVTYSLWGLLRGQGLAALRSVEADDVACDGDLTRPSAAPPHGRSAAPAPPLADLLPYPLPMISLTGQVHLRVPLPEGPDGEVTIPSLRVLGGGSALSVDLSQLTLPQLGISQERWSARCVVTSGRELQVSSHGPLAGISINTLTIVPEQDEQRFEADLGLAHGHLTLGLDQDHVGARLADIDVAQLPAWLQVLAAHQLPSRGILDGDVAMALHPAPAQESIDVQAHGLVWRKLSPSEAALRVVRNGAALTIDALALDNQRDHLAVASLVIDLDRLWLAQVAKSCEFRCNDVGALLGELDMPIPGICTATPMLVEGTITGHDLVLDHLRVDAHAGTSRVDVAGSAVFPVEAQWRHISLDGAWKAHLTAADFPCLGTQYRGTIDGSGLCSGTPLQPTADGTITSQDLTIAGCQLGALSISAAAAYPHLTLRRLELRQDANHVVLSGRADLATQTLEHLKAQLDCADLASLSAGLPAPMRLHGSLTAHVVIGAVRRDDLAGLLSHAEVSLEAEASHLEVGGVGLGDAQLSTTLHGGAIEIPTALLDGPYQARLSLSAQVAVSGAMSVEVRALAMGLRAVPLVQVVLRRPAHLSWAPGGRLGRWTVGGMELGALGGIISVNGHGAGETASADVHIYRLQPWALLPGWLKACCGMIDCSLTIDGALRQPLVAVHCSTIGLRILGRGSWLSLDARQTPQGIVLDGLGAHVASALDAHAVGQWPVAFGVEGMRELPGRPRMRLFLRSALVPGILPDRPGLPVTGIVSLTATSDASAARLDCSVRDMVVRLDGLTRTSKALEQITSVEAHARARSDGWTANLTVHDTVGLSVDLAASGHAIFTPAQPWRFVPTLLAEPVLATLDLSNLQISRLRTFVPSLVHLSGVAAGQLRLTGRIQNPAWNGELKLDQVSLKTRTDIPAMTDGTGLVRIAGEKVSIDKLSMRMGYAPVTATGWVDFSGTEPVLNVGMVADNALVVQNQSLRLRVDGSLSLVGPVSAMTLSGNLKITDALYSQPFELLSKLRPSGSKEPQPTQDQGIKLFSIRDEPLASVAFDVVVRAVQTLHVRTDLFSGNASMDLHIGGNGQSPVPTGQIWVDEAKVRLPFSSLNLTHADMVFTKNNPFFPGIEAVGETRLKGYDLTLRVTGNYPNVVVTVESDPPLDSNDGLMLLTTGLSDQDRDQTGASRSQLTSVGEYLAKEIWGQVAAPPDPDAKPSIFDLDRLDLNVGEEVSITGSETITANYQISDHFYLRGDRDIFDDYNMMFVWRIRAR